MPGERLGGHALSARLHRKHLPGLLAELDLEGGSPLRLAPAKRRGGPRFPPRGPPARKARAEESASQPRSGVLSEPDRPARQYEVVELLLDAQPDALGEP